MPPSDDLDRGSSPRRRGGLGVQRRSVGLGGVIPAQAGRTAVGCGHSGRGWGHPRAGGADLCVSCNTVREPGSSPRRRGGPRATCALAASKGVIPAQAGRTRCGRRTPSAEWGHPRAGGADLGARVRYVARAGSSPRRRGGPPSSRHGRCPIGVIPAQAGRTRFWRRGSGSGWGHPRAGGADGYRGPGVTTIMGSSPRRRGGPRRGRLLTELRRVIPAQAGRTSRTCAGQLRGWGHPRAGGADSAIVQAAFWLVGSSPRRRGGLSKLAPALAGIGVIPAQAGRTRRHRLCHRRWPGHPRAGGADPRPD